jgi:hypothetical protein
VGDARNNFFESVIPEQYSPTTREEPVRLCAVAWPYIGSSNGSTVPTDFVHWLNHERLGADAFLDRREFTGLNQLGELG